jgi:hypothetical protein
MHEGVGLSHVQPLYSGSERLGIHSKANIVHRMRKSLLGVAAL